MKRATSHKAKMSPLVKSLLEAGNRPVWLREGVMMIGKYTFKTKRGMLLDKQAQESKQ